MTDPTANGSGGGTPQPWLSSTTTPQGNVNSHMPFASTTTIRPQMMSVPSLVSNRGRKKVTPSTALRRPPLAAASAQASASVVPLSITKSTLSTSKAPSKALSSSSSSSHSSIEKIKSKKKSKKYIDWPSSSADALPKLAPLLLERLQDNSLEFPINEECTALTLSPSGRLMIACFPDGTIRLFDLTGTFSSSCCATPTNSSSSSNNNPKGKLEDNLFDMDSSSEEEEMDNDTKSPHAASFQQEQEDTSPKRGGRNRFVLSKEHQRFGTVACQIHAKGVITSLLMDVAVAEDGQYCFAGVLRGTQEMVAVHLGAVEAFLDKHLRQPQEHIPELLDLISVYRCSDAKLRGFGACTRVRNGTRSHPQYLLFTGKAIKNIHIWRFTPPTDPTLSTSEDDGTWTQLYDTQTNGNSIKLLQFRYDPNGLLQGISKSDDQKLRVWDLSFEQHQGDPKNPFFSRCSVIQKFAKEQRKRIIHKERPTKPLYSDATSSEATATVCGGFAFCYKDNHTSRISIVKLDVPDITSPYNHSELALPGSSSGVPSRSRRQQRGELKTITCVAGMAMDPSYVLLEVSDGSIIQYSDGNNEGNNGQPKVERAILPGTGTDPLQDGFSRKMCVGKVGSEGAVLAALSCYNSGSSRGTILLRPINGATYSSNPRQKGFWGFSRFVKKPKKAKSATTEPKVESTTKAIRVCARQESPSPIGQQQVGESRESPTASQQTEQGASSPHQPATDITQWTNPPTAQQATSSQNDSTTGVQLFGNPSEDNHAFKAAPLPKKRSQESLIHIASTTHSMTKPSMLAAIATSKRSTKPTPKLTNKIFSTSQAPTSTTTAKTGEPPEKKRKSIVDAPSVVPDSSVKATLNGIPMNGTPSAVKVAPKKSHNGQVSPDHEQAAMTSSETKHNVEASPDSLPPTSAIPPKQRKEKRPSLGDLAAAALSVNTMNNDESTKDAEHNCSASIRSATPQPTIPRPKAVDRVPATPNDTPTKLHGMCGSDTASDRVRAGVKEVSPDSKASLDGRCITASKSTSKLSVTGQVNAQPLAENTTKSSAPSIDKSTKTSRLLPRNPSSAEGAKQRDNRNSVRSSIKETVFVKPSQKLPSSNDKENTSNLRHSNGSSVSATKQKSQSATGRDKGDVSRSKQSDGSKAASKQHRCQQSGSSEKGDASMSTTKPKQTEASSGSSTQRAISQFSSCSTQIDKDNASITKRENSSDISSAVVSVAEEKGYKSASQRQSGAGISTATRKEDHLATARDKEQGPKALSDVPAVARNDDAKQDNQSASKATGKRRHADENDSSSGNQSCKEKPTKIAKTAEASDVAAAPTTFNQVKKPKVPKKTHRQFPNRDALLDQCDEQEVRITLLAKNHLPPSPVAQRMGLTDVSTPSDIASRQELSRMKLATQHRAEHEKVLKQCIGISLDAIEEARCAKSLAAVDAAEEEWKDLFRYYYEILEQVLWRQNEEATTLADEQGYENRESGLRHTPVLQVSFPFFSVFKEVFACMDAVFKTTAR
ncbi:expressed unknown protein [Seminavis robusta]|uniref:Uncharacterized protein n=1 Tax=Seminavis robusta TaxID=568900 RepID=A0A9N8DD57_9STRA|nr:expressed unknown protein [Seminavis robusta]|eukprot:Sro40_g024700.1 n/a (1508) ;mRNA; f:80165-84778